MTYYKDCPTCNGRLTLKDACVSNSDSWPCPTCEGAEFEGLVPVAEGAIIIEDGFDAALDRMVKFILGRDLDARLRPADLLRAAIGAAAAGEGT